MQIISIPLDDIFKALYGYHKKVLPVYDENPYYRVFNQKSSRLINKVDLTAKEMYSQHIRSYLIDNIEILFPSFEDMKVQDFNH